MIKIKELDDLKEYHHLDYHGNLLGCWHCARDESFNKGIQTVIDYIKEKQKKNGTGNTEK